MVAVEKQKALQIRSVCLVLRYPTCNAHAPYCHLWPDPLYNIFPHYLTNGAIFGKNVTENKMSFDFFLRLCVKNSSLEEELSEIWPIMCNGLHVKHQLLLSDCNETWVSSTDFRKILKYQISRKSVPWKPSCSVRTDGRIVMTKLMVVFRNFVKASKSILFIV
jgi:hypothetical protein